MNLWLRVLPYGAKEDIFALKGGTTINLFVRDKPRLSTDNDLTYLPFDSRGNALKNIQEGLTLDSALAESAFGALFIKFMNRAG